ncbi:MULTISPECIES: hypothetical protein [unclassified Sporolactobacillus]|nr:hypothetical protein [Sporolactobacillus sp. CQH2019]MDD9150586.1 hypothetical protein [Sporolactobacillus sp. CQH2019]
MPELSMQAVQVHEYGGDEVLQLEKIKRPQPSAEEILVKIHYASVLPLD